MIKNNEANWPSYISEDLKNNINGSKHWFELNKHSLERVHIVPEDEQKNDPKNLYTYNSLNFRSPEFFEDPDILTIGCSHTWGVGVPDGTLWPAVLAKQLNLSYANLGVPGASIYSAINVAMAYVEKYGKPKHIVGLLPDFRRLSIIQRTDVNTSIKDLRNLEERAGYESNLLEFGSVFFSDPEPGQGSLIAKYSKKPHSFSDVLPIEVPLFINIAYLNLFQKYCESNEISLSLSSWDDDTVDVFRHLNISNFYYLKYERDTVEGDYIYINDCHPNAAEEHGDNWYKGADHTKDFSGHIGIHRHLDYAEMFAKKIREL